MAGEQPELSSIRVSQFAYCDCGKPPYDGRHLAVRTFGIRLDNNFAVAVSYGIGDFDRASRLVGHRKDNADDPVHLTLGGEWVVADLVTALVKLSNRKGSVWLDQLSIPQEPDEIAQQLQNVPAIYTILEVIILLPHSPCPCLADTVRSYEAGETAFATTLLDEPDFDIGRLVAECPIAWPAASYFTRLWTKLELRYSCELSVTYCSGPASICFQQDQRPSNTVVAAAQRSSESSKLGQYLRYHYPLLDTESWPSVRSSLVHFWFRGIIALMMDFAGNYRSRSNSRDGSIMSLGHNVATLLLGGEMQRPRVPPRSVKPPQLWYFDTSHRATVPSDMVTAVFVVSSLYKVPLQRHRMKVAELLEDALSQVEAAGMFYVSTLPQGLFSTGSPDQTLSASMLCKPTLYLHENLTISMTALYGPFRHASASLPTSRGTLMLRSRTTQAARRSKMRHAKSYEAAFGHASTREVFEFLCSFPYSGAASGVMGFTAAFNSSFGLLSDDFRAHCTEYAKDVVRGRQTPPREPWPDRDYERAMLIIAVRDYFLPRTPEPCNWSTCELPEIDHYNAVYDIMCGAARLDPQVAQSAGLELVVQTGLYPAIGLISANAYSVLCNSELARPPQGHAAVESDKQPFEGSSPWLSVAMIQHLAESFVYETLRVVDGAEGHEAYDAGQKMASYAVVGVWLYQPPDDPYIGAEVTEDRSECDMLLI